MNPSETHEPTDQLPVDPAAPDATAPAAKGGDATRADVGGDALLDRAARIADLPLDERPAAFDALNRSLVAELHALEDA